MVRTNNTHRMGSMRKLELWMEEYAMLVFVILALGFTLAAAWSGYELRVSNNTPPVIIQGHMEHDSL